MYLPPSPSQDTTNKPNKESEDDSVRFTHRRTRSATPTFSTESGTTAFSPLVGLPRRQRQYEKKTLFHIAPDDDEEAENAQTSSITLPRHSPPAEERPEPRIQVSVASTPPVSDIPFPSTSAGPVESSLPFPSLDPPTPSVPSASRSSSISRSGSTPILLANGKPLKPSLKSSVSSPQITDWRAQHPRSKSEPSTPVAPKTVHFPEKKDNLESVVVFEKTARPRAVSGNADDTETETEGYDSPANAGMFGGQGGRFSQPSEKQFGLDIDQEQSSPVPPKEPTAFSNVYMETLVFPRTRPPTLRGSILVKNVAFEKSVALRFTLDNWQTTSEVVCRHVCTLPSLPSPFPPERQQPGVPSLAWDRFSFLVRLEDVERKLAERTIFFAARFQASGVGEWWDNNNGANYKLVFKKAPVSVPNGVPAKGPSPLRNVEGPNSKKMFPGLDLRPVTMSLDSADSTLPPLKLRRPFSPVASLGMGRSSPPPKSAPSAPQTSSAPVFAAPPGPTNVATSTNINGALHQRNASNSSIASSGSSGSLKLSNYASPVSPVTSSRRDAPGRSSISMFLNGGEMSMLGGQPVTSPPPVNISPNSSMLNIPDRDGRLAPFIQRRSPTNSLLSMSTASPASSGPPATPASPFPTSSSNPLSPARSPSFTDMTSGTPTPPASGTPIPGKNNISSYPFSPTNGLPTDSTYAALVEKWCFHQSPPPAGASADGSPTSEVSTPGLSAGVNLSTSPFGAFDSAAAGYGSGYGYGHHHIAKPVSLKP